MDNFEIPPFYVGQEVVAVKDHSQGTFKKGDEFIVEYIVKSTCNCEVNYHICINIITKYVGTDCAKCGCELHKVLNLYKHSLFAPKIQLSEFVSMKEVVQLETVGAN